MKPHTHTGGPEAADAAEAAAAASILAARRVCALTGAGVSVESGIPDFRSPGGLWSVFDPAEYATLSCFRDDPEKAWRLYRALGSSLAGREPNPAHRALAELEARGRLAGLVTQNVDGLHQRAGSVRVIEIHGEHAHLHCLACERLEPFRAEHLEPGPVPVCPCGAPLKPNVVLFEEAVRGTSDIARLLDGCDLLLVAGTSAEVWPAAGLPGQILSEGGSIVEFNLAPTALTWRGLGSKGVFVQGPVGTRLPQVVARVAARDPV